MKKTINTIKNRMNLACIKAQTAVKSALTDTRGDLATNTIGAIIVGVVIVGLLIAAVNSFFPGFFTSMFEAMKTKLSGNW